MFDHLGQFHYDKSIAEKAPLYQDIQARKEKTSFTEAIVEKLNTDDFIFVQCDKNRDNQYFAYNMDNEAAFRKVREKVSQAIRDFNLNQSSLDAIQGVDGARRPIPEENEGNEIGNNALNPPEIDNMEGIPLPPPENEMEYESNEDDNDCEFDIHDPNLDNIFASDVEERFGTTIDRPVLEEDIVAVGNVIGNIALNPLEEIPFPPPENEMEYESNVDDNDWEFDIHDPNLDDLFASDLEYLANEHIGTTMDTNFDIDILQDLAVM